MEPSGQQSLSVPGQGLAAASSFRGVPWVSVTGANNNNEHGVESASPANASALMTPASGAARGNANLAPSFSISVSSSAAAFGPSAQELRQRVDEETRAADEMASRLDELSRDAAILTGTATHQRRKRQSTLDPLEKQLIAARAELARLLSETAALDERLAADETQVRQYEQLRRGQAVLYAEAFELRRETEEDRQLADAVAAETEAALAAEKAAAEAASAAVRDSEDVAAMSLAASMTQRLPGSDASLRRRRERGGDSSGAEKSPHRRRVRPAEGDKAEGGTSTKPASVRPRPPGSAGAETAAPGARHRRRRDDAPTSRERTAKAGPGGAAQVTNPTTTQRSGDHGPRPPRRDANGAPPSGRRPPRSEGRHRLGAAAPKGAALATEESVMIELLPAAGPTTIRLETMHDGTARAAASTSGDGAARSPEIARPSDIEDGALTAEEMEAAERMMFRDLRHDHRPVLGWIAHADAASFAGGARAAGCDAEAVERRGTDPAYTRQEEERRRDDRAARELVTEREESVRCARARATTETMHKTMLVTASRQRPSIATISSPSDHEIAHDDSGTEETTLATDLGDKYTKAPAGPDSLTTRASHQSLPPIVRSPADPEAPSAERQAFLQEEFDRTLYPTHRGHNAAPLRLPDENALLLTRKDLTTTTTTTRAEPLTARPSSARRDHAPTGLRSKYSAAARRSRQREVTM
jgi:hypothetical protein